MNDRVWFYVETGTPRGPYTAAEIVDAVRRLGPSTFVWREGLAEWVPAETVPEFAPAPWPAPPPVPGSAPLVSSEPYTLNPLVLWRRGFAWSGRFSRSEFAVALLGFGLVGLVGFGIGQVVMSAAGPDRNTSALLAVGLLALVWVPIAFVVSVGSTVRRLHDLGQSGWLALVSFVPCVSLVFLVYLLAAQGREGAAPSASAPASGTVPILIVVAGVMAVVIVIPMIGIIAAIAIPSLLRARVAANEASAIGNVRTVVSAQGAYQSVNQGFYEGRWECLSSAQTCIPGYAGPTFLDAALFGAPRSGYLQEMHGGAQAAAAQGSSPSSTDGFAVIAYPVIPGKTGVRAFCGDSSGRICAIANGGKDELVTGSGRSGVRCADACLELR
jgi:uncharacterized membrane protein YhaH (DUF805 family)